MSSNMDAALPFRPPSGIPSLSIGLSVPDADPLTQSEARFRALAQATGQIYWITDGQGRLTDVTSWCAFTGQSPEEAAGDGWANALHPDDREPALAHWKATAAARQPYRHEHHTRRADGQYRMMLVQAYPVLDADGVVREWVGVDTDITLLQELRADVEASQEDFRATFEQAAVGIAHVRLEDGHLLRINRKFCEILGYSQEELRTRTFQELTYPPDLDNNLALFEQLLASKISTYTLEKRYIRKDGSIVWVTLTSSLKRDRAGTPEYGIAVIEDISARKAAEEALRQSEQQTREALRALLRMAELLVQRPVESEEQRSPQVGQHLAESACSLLGCPVAIILTLDPQTLGMRVMAAVGHTPTQEEQLRTIVTSWTHTAPDLAHLARLMAGETLVLDITEPPYQEVATLFEIQQAIVAPMRLGGRLIGMLVFTPGKLTHTFTDQQIALAGATAQLVGLVVEREGLLREREEARAHALALHESHQQMDTFLSLVSHELRTPLATMKLAIQLIYRRLERAFSDASEAESDLSALLTSLQELFAPVERQTARLERLVKDLLDASRGKEGKLEPMLARVDLRAIVQEVVVEQRDLHPERVIQLYMPTETGDVVPASLPAGVGSQALSVLVDSDFIRQAVVNYLANALKYSPPPSPVLVGVEQQAGQALVWVRDQGPGIAPQDQERIWDRFYRVPGIREHREAAAGLGLGLYVTKMLIERHQGQVGMTSTPGQGTTFWFTLPLAE